MSPTTACQECSCNDSIDEQQGSGEYANIGRACTGDGDCSSSKLKCMNGTCLNKPYCLSEMALDESRTIDETWKTMAVMLIVVVSTAMLVFMIFCLLRYTPCGHRFCHHHAIYDPRLSHASRQQTIIVNFQMPEKQDEDDLGDQPGQLRVEDIVDDLQLEGTNAIIP